MGKIWECIVEKLGEEMKVNGQVYSAFALAEALARASVDEMRECRLSRYKVRYIKWIAQSIAKGDSDAEELRQISRGKAM